MRLARWKAVAAIGALAAFLSLPAWGNDTDNRHNAMPGTLNYVEGQASIGDQTLDSKSVGTAELQNGQVLETGDGKAEILLTPGVFLRLGSNSSVKMDSNSLTNIHVSLRDGEAMLEVDNLYKENFIHISQPGADTRIEQAGLYDFDASHQRVRVFDGKAIVSADERNTTVKKGHECRGARRTTAASAAIITLTDRVRRPLVAASHDHAVTSFRGGYGAGGYHGGGGFHGGGFGGGGFHGGGGGGGHR